MNGRLLQPVKSLYSCSEVCVRAGGVKSQQFIVDIGFPTRTCAVKTNFHNLDGLEAQSQQQVKFKSLGLYSGVIEGGKRSLAYGFVKHTQFCVSFIALW